MCVRVRDVREKRAGGGGEGTALSLLKSFQGERQVSGNTGRVDVGQLGERGREGGRVREGERERGTVGARPLPQDRTAACPARRRPVIGDRPAPTP